MCFCTHKSLNDLQRSSFSRCFLYKDLELDTMKLPKVIFLVGNDAFNTFYNEDCTVPKILGDVYVSEYKGEKRLFIPIPHIVYLLRDKDLYRSTMLLLKVIANKDNVDKIIHPKSV